MITCHPFCSSLSCMHFFLDTIEINAQQIEFSFFPENKNGKLQTCKGRLLNQNTSAKGKTFYFRNALYVDDSMFLFNTRTELEETANRLQKHFARFGLIMHVGNSTTKSKSEAMYFPPSLAEARKLEEEGYIPEDIKLPDNDERIGFAPSFKYLGSVITPLLNEDAEIAMRIKKAKSIMGLSRHFFDCRDVDIRVKYQIYTAGPLNTLLWGCEGWNT